MTSPFVVLVDDGIEKSIAGVFDGDVSAMDWISEVAPSLAEAGVSATMYPVALLPATMPIGDVVVLMFERRSAEMRRLAAIRGGDA